MSQVAGYCSSTESKTDFCLEEQQQNTQDKTTKVSSTLTDFPAEVKHN